MIPVNLRDLLAATRRAQAMLQRRHGKLSLGVLSPNAWRERRIMRAYRSCLYRGPALDTGCNCRRVCHAGKGDRGIVRTEDCRACVATLAITDQRTA